MTNNTTRRALLTGAPALVAATAIPQAFAAEPVTKELLDAYNMWLWYERKLVADETYPEAGGKAYQFVPVGNSYGWHFADPYFGKEAPPPPSTRAAMILSLVGCDWRTPV